MAKAPKYTYQEALAKISAEGLRNLKTQDLKAVGRPLMKVARERVRRLEQAGLTTSPAYRAYKEKKGMKSTVNLKDRNEILHEVYEAYRFLTKASTSTVKGAKKSIENMKRLLGPDLTQEQIDAVWDIYHRIENENPYAFQKYGYDQIIGIASNKAREHDFDVDAAIDFALMEVDYMENHPFEELDEEWTDIWGTQHERF